MQESKRNPELDPYWAEELEELTTAMEAARNSCDSAVMAAEFLDEATDGEREPDLTEVTMMAEGIAVEVKDLIETLKRIRRGYR